MICLSARVLLPNFKILIRLVFLISPILLPGKNSQQFASSSNFAEKEIKLLFEKIDEIKHEFPHSCLLFFEKAMKINGENKQLQGLTNLKMGWVFYDTNKYKEAFEYFNKVLEIGNQINDKELLYKAYTGLGVAHWPLSNLWESVQCDLKALDIGIKMNNEHHIAISKLNLGYTYCEIKKYEKPYSYYIQAKELFDKLDDLKGTTLIINNICRLLLDQEKYTEALQFLENELPLLDAGDDQRIACLLQANHAVALLGNGKIEVDAKVEELVSRSNQSIINIVDTVWSLDENESELGHLIDKIEDIIHSEDFRKEVKEIEYVKNIENEMQFLSMKVRHHLLMIFKEGINNIQKHTFSDFVKVKFQENNKLLGILIYNKFNAVKNPDYSNRRGLINIKKRVSELGGQINLEKSSDHFSIQINIKI